MDTAIRTEVRYALPVPDAVAVDVDRLPSGELVLRLTLDRDVAELHGHYVAWLRCPRALELDGTLYVATGYSSDTGEAFYRAGAVGRRAAIVV